MAVHNHNDALQGNELQTVGIYQKQVTWSASNISINSTNLTLLVSMKHICTYAC